MVKTRTVHLIRHTLRHGHGSYSPRLRTRDHLAVEMWEVIIEDELWDLGRLSGTRLTDEDQDLGLLVELEELRPLRMHGQVATSL